MMISTASAQNNNLIVYSQDGLKFTVILNGIRQNAEPQTNVKVTGLNAPNYQVKIIFANNLPDLDQNAYLMYGGENSRNTEFSYAIVWAKDKYKLKFKSAAPIDGNITEPGQTVVVYTPVNAVPSTTVTSGGTTAVTGTTTGTTTVTTTTVGTTGTTGGTVGVNVGVPGVGVSVNVGAPGVVGGTVTETSTTTYSTTTTTSSGVSTDINTTGTTQGTYVLPGYNGVYGCPYPMSGPDFESAKKSIASKSFDDSRLTIAKQIIGSNCLLCSQIKELMEIMSFEATKLELAKFAWHHNLDRGNYYKLNDAFDFETSIDELNQYTSTH
jgi:hypothetical protein